VLLPDIVPVKDDRVMAPELELELLEAWHDEVGKIRLLENAKRQRKDGKIAVDRLQAVIAALVDIHDMIAEIHLPTLT